WPAIAATLAGVELVNLGFSGSALLDPFTARAIREAARRARGALDAAQERLRRAWRDFDAVRDGLARFGPPAADRDDVAAAWAALAGWAGEQAQARRAERDGLADSVEAAQRAAAEVADGIAALFTAAGLDAPQDAPRDVAVAVERAEAELRRLDERREQAAELREQRAGHEHEARVARALASHLRANNFERWLLTEALDLLVDGASGILRELSGGQYDLMHDKGEFFVVDHHDAGLRRGVRTLSGGETFQASLALALALSEQLAGMSTTAASLESIVLDEGFGTLDAATLDTVAATLENLAARGDRMVGVVTHVPALAERIPVRFEVRKDARTARVERTGL
ncbi:SbcC/MukB-like Walker B domain-containing protein, partial [Micromonospora tulbaghiae]|uniref:SbcC/MukB-like Walker B domain-containing protein n=1 Tax=Micromonospora tulbaghiae TaxID=479978 RepID=UPI0033DD7E66